MIPLSLPDSRELIGKGMMPYENIPLSGAKPFDCRKDAVRHPRETKGADYDVTEATGGPYCGSDGNCC